VGQIGEKQAAKQRDDVSPAGKRRVMWKILVEPHSGDMSYDKDSYEAEGGPNLF
jgi:hypothetical protein